MMSRWIIAFLVLLGVVGIVVAQILLVNLNTKNFIWVASVVDATHGAPTSYTVKCGATSGTYTLFATVQAPTTTIPVKSVVTSGKYFCVVTASNLYGESGPSNEINIDAGYSANAPTGFGTQ